MRENTAKPDWLVKLEAESWQAELLISGVALLGATQLPQLVEYGIDMMLHYINPKGYRLFYALFMVLYFGVFSLIAGLIIHFILRAFWVGLIGFNSVFAGKIDVENDNFYSKVFLRRIADKE